VIVNHPSAEANKITENNDAMRDALKRYELQLEK
jgi:hypothetical protein